MIARGVGAALLVATCAACAACSANAAPPQPPTVAPTPAAAIGATSAPAPPSPVPAAPTPAPTAAKPTEYIVRPGDTFWDIAVAFRLSLDELVGANPGLAPDLIHPGDKIVIPPEGVPATPPPRPAGPHVDLDADGLRLRDYPGLQGAVLRYLAALTPLDVTARSADGAWYEVSLKDGARGWVSAGYVANRPNPSTLQEKRVQVPPTPSPVALAAARTPVASVPTSRFVSNLTEAARQIYRKGIEMGNNPRAFAVVGDSNSVAAPFLRGFDRGAYDLGEYSQLEDTLRYYKGSFDHNSAAAMVGYTALRLLTPPRDAKAPCLPNESFVACEYRLKRPSVALILLGTNDSAGWRTFEQDYRELVEFTIKQGIVPVLITKGDTLESTRYGAPPGVINQAITKIAREYGVPFVDLRAAVEPLPNGGMGADGFHYSFAPDGRSTFLVPQYMTYGFTQRNLTALQALDAVRRLVAAR